MNDLGKLLFIIGIVLVILGAVIWKTGGLGGLGRLPGDSAETGERKVLLPIVTCLLLSAVPGLLAWLFRRSRSALAPVRT